MVFLGATRTVSLQSVKARIPSIRFRKGGSPAPAGHAGGSAGAAPQQAAARAGHASVSSGELPARFRRQLISQEEIDYINRGGPA